MSNSLFVTAIEARSGKSLVSLGVADLLVRRVERLAFFRPAIDSGDGLDNDSQLLRDRYCPTVDPRSMYAVTREEARELYANDQYDQMLKLVLAKYKELEAQCDFVLCEGTDFTGFSSALEFDFNARVANHLGCPVLIVVSGVEKGVSELINALGTAREAFENEGCTITALIANRVSPRLIDDFRRQVDAEWEFAEPVFAIPEHESLGRPTVGEIRNTLNARILSGSEASLHREALDFKVAAMQLPNFLDHIGERSLVITPGDRGDILLASLATVHSEKFAPIAGVLLTGGIPIADSIRRLIDGLKHVDVPVLSVDDDTFSAAAKVAKIRAAIAPDNERKIAAALGLFESCIDAEQLEQRVEFARPQSVTPLMFEYQLIERAKTDRQHVVLPEGKDDRILRATEILLRRGVADITLLGDRDSIEESTSSLGIDLTGAKIIDPAKSEWRSQFGKEYFRLRKHKGVTEEVAYDTMLDVSYFGTMMVHQGLADAMVSGAAHTTGHTIRPALEFIRPRPGCSIVSSVFFMCLPNRVLVYGDCAIVPNPTPPQLADIAVSSADTAIMLGIEPRVALLSYSTGESGRGDDVDRVREATKLAQEMRPDLLIDGPMQYDAAIDPGVGKLKSPDSQVAGRATVFIFPDLNTGNNTYKAVQRSSGAVAVGPVLQGLNKPVNDLSRGCTVTDIVNTVAITAVQAQQEPLRQ
ncbi:MAG: phosphate acetyltransferase [Planctomycetota bacterium]